MLHNQYVKKLQYHGSEYNFHWPLNQTTVRQPHNKGVKCT